MEANIEELTENQKEIILLTGTTAEFETFLSRTNRTTKNTVAVRQGYQIPLYPDLEIYHWGTYWLNSAYASLEYTERLNRKALEDFEAAKNE